MSRTPLEVINLTDNYRLAIEYDLWNYPYIDLTGEEWQVVSYRTADRYNDLTGRDDVAKDLEQLIASLKNLGKTTDEIEQAIGTHLDRAERPYRLMTISDGSGWTDVVAFPSKALAKEIIDDNLNLDEMFSGVRNALWNWWNGLIYHLALEKLTIWHNDNGDTMTTWEDADEESTMSCVMAESENEFIELAKSAFPAMAGLEKKNV